MEKDYLSYYCRKCHAHYLISKVIREDNEFTAYLKCPNSHWYYKHPELLAFSHNQGATWSLSNIRTETTLGAGGGFIIPQEFGVELLQIIFDDEAVGLGHAHRCSLLKPYKMSSSKNDTK
jgi:hypothetical protein